MLWKAKKGSKEEKSYLPLQNVTSPVNKIMHWKNMIGSTQERSHFLAPTVKNHLFIIILWRHMKMSTGEENHLPVLFLQVISTKSCKDPYRRESISLLQWHTTEKSHLCIQIVKWFVQSSGLKTHQRIFGAERPFTCTKCGMSFTQSRVLKMHERIHILEKLFAGSKYDKSFRKESNCATGRK